MKSTSIGDALEDHPRGFTVRFEVVPGTSHVLVPSGFNPWRKSLEARLTERAERGKANRQLVQEVARIFEVSREDVDVMSGHKSSRKVLLVRGHDRAAALRVLNSLFLDGQLKCGENDGS